MSHRGFPFGHSLKALPFVLLLGAMGCSKNFQALSGQAEQASSQVGCQDLESKMYDVVYAALKDQNRLVTVDELKGAFTAGIEKQFPQWPPSQRDAASGLAADFYSRLPLGTGLSGDPKKVLVKVLQAEMGVTNSPEAQATQDLLKQWRSVYDSEKTSFDNSNCQSASGGGTSTPTTPQPTPSPGTGAQATPTPLPPNPPVVDSPQVLDPMVYNARKVLMTAYQNCAAGDLDPIGASVPNVAGIKIIGQNGAGYLRTISSLPELLQTDYYLQGLKLPNSSCFDVSKNPLIYNYGGKPYATSTAGSPLNLFVEAGNGSKTLGIDCSGYVVTAVATSGLRFSPNQDVKPLLVEAINSTMFTNPASNGMSCFNKVAMGVEGTLQAGDIVATDGHVFIIDSTGPDPLAIGAAATDAACNSITSNQFDFVIAQSDPSKDGIGINRIHAAYYLTYTSDFKSGFETYARAACHAKFAGTNVLTTNAGITVIRHNHTDACLSKNPVPLDGVQCIASCGALTSIAPEF